MKNALNLEGYRLLGVDEIAAAFGVKPAAIYTRKSRGTLTDILPPPDIEGGGKGSSQIYWKSTTLRDWFEGKSK